MKQGVVFASNKGSDISKGKYIARMDADDWSFPERLENQKKFLDENPSYDAVSSLVEYIPHNNKTEGFQKYVVWSNSIQTFEDISLKRFIESPIINPTAMWRESSELKFGNYIAGNFPEDYELWLRWLNKGAKIHKLNQILLKWTDSDTRLTRTDELYSVEAFYKIKSSYLANWLKKNNPFHPKVLIWGASRISRKRAEILNEYGIQIEAYIDIHCKRQLNESIIHYKDLPKAGKHFILTYLNYSNKREEILDFLSSKGYIEGHSFLVVS